MTSSSNKTDMEAAIGAVFNGLNIGVSAEYQNTINNSTFEAQVYGGTPSSLITSLEEVITYINDGLTITNLQSAVPIDYHVHYLDGSSFNTGDEIEYTETDYEVTNASTMVIKKVMFTQLPHMEENYWEPGIGGGSYPDVYLQISKYNGSSWETINSYVDDYFNETTSTMLDNHTVFWDTNFEISDFNMIYAFDAWDYDSGEDDFMTDMQFTVNNDIINSGDFPTTKILYDSDKNIRVELQIEWAEK